MSTDVPRFFRILESGARLHCDLPELQTNPERFEKYTGLGTDSIRFALEFTKNSRDAPVPIAFGALAADLSFTVDLSGQPGGVYTVRLDAIPLGGAEPDRRVFWMQHVFAQPTLRRSPEAIHDIAMRYAPIFLYSRDEKYFPVSLHDLLRHQTLLESDGHVNVETVTGPAEIPIRRLDEFLRFNGHAEYLLDQSFLSFDESAFRAVHGDFRRSVVYYSYLEDRDSDRFFINYHTFYAFDPKTGIAKLLNIGPHIFDRESLTMVFDGEERPVSLVLSGHLENQAILFLERLKMWNTGRVRINLPDAASPAVQEHPIVAVAEGSHALYPAAGAYHISVLTEVAGHIFQSILGKLTDAEDTPHEMDSHQVLLPPHLQSDRFANYELRALRFDLLRSEGLPPQSHYDPASACLVFSGYWVDVPGMQNERFPPFSRKERDIEDWIDNAFPWNWSELPEDVARHNQALSEYIAERLK